MTRSKLQNKNLKSKSKKSILGLDDQGLIQILLDLGQLIIECHKELSKSE